VDDAESERNNEFDALVGEQCKSNDVKMHGNSAAAMMLAGWVI
jgi:hypothetical protein